MKLQRGLEFIDLLMGKLFEAEQRRIDRSVEELDRQNREVKGHKTYGFIHQGRVFMPQNNPNIPDHRGRESLAFPLHKQGNMLVQDLRAVSDDKQMIEQLVYLLIKDCETVQSVRDTLPESLVGLSDELAQYTRLSQEGYTLDGNERAQRQFAKLKDKIDFYTATRLIY